MPTISPTESHSWPRGRALISVAVVLMAVAALRGAMGLGAELGTRLAAATTYAMTATAEQVAAPELDGGTAWLNSAGPIKLADLRGRIVLLDFWTLCCINCMHIMPELAKLEAKYPGLLVVLGIHTPKFPNEKETESIRKAVLRYEIAHPVINDSELAIWNRYKVQSWPTLVLIDPDGNIVHHQGGEGQYETLDRLIGQLAKTYRAKKKLNEKPLKFELARFSETGASPLFFPGKVLADQKSNRLFIADSTHHRIVITDLDGKKIAVAGTGVSGKKDGAFDQATFNDPQGMAVSGDSLYVADRRNHMIRKLDLAKHTVVTIAGTGEQDHFARNPGGVARKTALASPWDLLLHDKMLYIAMAGHHQIWVCDLAKGLIGPFAGDANENLRDGPLGNSSFAQPSGLASDGQTLWVADSETSSIRALPLSGMGYVQTLVGKGLFDYGDNDGAFDKARLQHPLGIVYNDGKLLVADTYNSKIKMLNPVDRICTTFVGEGGGKGADSTFNAPGGLSLAGNKLYVADTNGHRIRVVDMTTHEVTTLALQGVEAPPMPESKEKK